VYGDTCFSQIVVDLAHQLIEVLLVCNRSIQLVNLC
jgi:hypothetical protein